MIPITQFVRPNGRRLDHSVEGAPAEVDAKANECIKAGARFTVEVLQNERIAAACEYDLGDDEGTQDIAIEIAERKRKLTDAFTKLVNDAHKIIMDNKENKDVYSIV